MRTLPCASVQVTAMTSPGAFVPVIEKWSDAVLLRRGGRRRGRQPRRGRSDAFAPPWPLQNHGGANRLRRIPGSPPSGTAQIRGGLSAPGVRRPPVRRGDIVGAVAYRVAQPDQDVVQRSGRLLPARLLDAVRLSGLPGPDFLQWRDLGAQIRPARRSVGPRWCGSPGGRCIRSRRSCRKHVLHVETPQRLVATEPIWCEWVSAASRSVCSIEADRFGDPLQCRVEFDRFGVPPVDDVVEAGRGRPAPNRGRHTAHPSDEGLQHRPDLLVACVGLPGDGRHQVEVGVERAACRCRHRCPSVLSVCGYESSTRPPIRFRLWTRFSEHRVRGPNRSIAGLAHEAVRGAARSGSRSRCGRSPSTKTVHATGGPGGSRDTSPRLCLRGDPTD